LGYLLVQTEKRKEVMLRKTSIQTRENFKFFFVLAKENFDLLFSVRKLLHALVLVRSGTKGTKQRRIWFDLDEVRVYLY